MTSLSASASSSGLSALIASTSNFLRRSSRAMRGEIISSSSSFIGRPLSEGLLLAARARALALRRDRGALDQLIDLTLVVGVVAGGHVNLLDWDLEVLSGLFDRALVLADRRDEVGDVEAGAQQGGPAPGGTLPEVDQRVLVTADALLDIALGKRSLAVPGLRGAMLEAPHGDRVEAEADALSGLGACHGRPSCRCVLGISGGYIAIQLIRVQIAVEGAAGVLGGDSLRHRQRVRPPACAAVKPSRRPHRVPRRAALRCGSPGLPAPGRG